MVKSRKSSKTLPGITRCHSPQLQVNNLQVGTVAIPSLAEASAVGERPPSRSPGCRSVRDELDEVTRLGRMLNYSDEQSSETEEDDDIEPLSSMSDARFLSNPSSSPAPGINAVPVIDPGVPIYNNATSSILGSEIKASLSNIASANEAALAFQRWRISRLKALFTQEINKVSMEAQEQKSRLSLIEEEMEKKEKHLQHALADSAQLRAQLSALETVNGQQHDSSDALKMDLAKALERATSSEAEVERYNKEIRKLRERLKSTQDEAYRLDSELKANASYFQKEKDGIAKENQVLLEQLARKDEELFSYVQEINNLKNVFTCLKVSRLELERLKSELQNNTFEETPETMGWYVLQNQIKSEGPLMGLNDAKQNAVPSDPVLSQILEVLQKLTNCLPKNETQLESSEVKVPESEEKHMVRSDRPQKGALYSEAAVNCKSMGNVGQVSSLNPKNDSTGDPCSACSQMLERKGEILFIITCWKWRWFIAARTVQKLSKEISSLKSVKKGKIRDVQQSPFLNFLDNINPSGVNGHAKNARPSNISFQEPIGADKMLTLLASICKLSSRSAHQEKEAYDKGRRFDHLLRIMMRWMQRARKRRQLERVITHWLRYLLQSCKDKFKKCNMAVSQAVNPGKGSCHTSHFMNTSQLASIPRARIVGNISTDFRKECQRSEKYEHTCKSQAFTTLQESLHQEFEVLEYSILKAISNWQQKECGDADISSEGFRESPTSLLWKISCDMEHCFFESRNQIMAYFGVKNASSATNISKVHRSISTFPSKPLIRQMRLKVGNCKKPPEKSSFPQCVARKKKKIFL